jgi:Tol biopolymer transport system component
MTAPLLLRPGARGALLVGLLALPCGCTADAPPQGRSETSPTPSSETRPPVVEPVDSCLNPEWTPRPGTVGPDHDIAFVSDLGGPLDLWVIEPDGDERSRLTRDPWTELTPRWSPDGTRLAFACSTTEDGNLDLYVLASDGSREQVTATSDCEVSPAWSPDGQRIYFSANDCDDGPSTIRVVDVAGGDAREILRIGGWFDLSPDGDFLVYDVPRSPDSFLDVSLWHSNAAGGAATEIHPAGVPASYEPAWSPDGRRIAFVAPSGDMDAADPVDWNEDIYVTDPSGTELRRVTSSGGNDHWPPAWSPDGRTLLYSADGMANRHGVLTAVDVRTLETTPLTKGGSSALFPTWR